MCSPPSANAYRTRRGDVAGSAKQITAAMGSMGQALTDYTPLSRDTMSLAFAHVCATASTHEHGGFGTAPKFPQSMALDFLLRHHARTGDAHALEMVELTLNRMARGGMYDQLGGGFHRYSTDPFWLVPHFEKMLYDNALLSRLYIHAYQATGNPFYARIAQETIDYVLREMTDPLGGFYSAQDADSEGEEGKFFVWTPGRDRRRAGPRGRRNRFRPTSASSHEGNFEGRNILHLTEGNWRFLAGNMTALSPEANGCCSRTAASRIPPATDTKVLTAWNGLMLHSIALGAAVLHRPDYLQAAIANATFLLSNMKRDGRLLRTYRDGTGQAQRLPGGLRTCSPAASSPCTRPRSTAGGWTRPSDLARRMLDLYWDEREAKFYDTGTDHETLIVRPRDITDNAMPSGGSSATDVLLRLSVLTDEPSFARTAAAALQVRSAVHGPHTRRLWQLAWRAGLPPVVAPRDRHRRPRSTTRTRSRCSAPFTADTCRTACWPASTRPAAPPTKTCLCWRTR